MEFKETSWRKELPLPLHLRKRGCVAPGVETRTNMWTYLSSLETLEIIRKGCIVKTPLLGFEPQPNLKRTKNNKLVMG